MALSCPIELDVQKLRADVRAVYARVATSPHGEFHFHRGPGYAALRLGYDAGELARLPRRSTAAFAGVGNPLAMAEPGIGETVVDVGSGGGTDLLLAARRVGPTGRAIGVDMTPEMLECATASADDLDLDHVVLWGGDAEALPLEDGLADVVISNGVLNLATDKRQAFGEITRVLKPGGRLLLADILLDRPLPAAAAQDIDLWAG